MKTDSQSNSKTTVETTGLIEIPSGFPKYRSRMFIGFALLTIFYCGCIAFFDPLRTYLQMPPSADEFCKQHQQLQQQHNDSPPSSTCWRADLFAFEVVSGLVLIWAGCQGFYLWHVQNVRTSVPDTPEGRLFGYIDGGDVLCAVSTTFQLFDLVVSLLIPEQRQFLFLCHHIMAATVSWYGLNNQYFHYYGIFYLGCSEISTIPLVALDMAKFFPPIPDSTYDVVVNGICGPVFAVTFTYYRVILWWSVGYQMFTDIFQVMNNGTARKLRPGRDHVLYVMMALNVLLGALQLYWFNIILGEAAKVIGINGNSSLSDSVVAEGIKEQYL